MRSMGTVLVMLIVAGALALACGESAPQYQVVVRFNTTVTQPDMDEVAGILRTYDDGLDFYVQETFPPTGVAIVRTSAFDFCNVAEFRIGSSTAVGGVECHEVTDTAPVQSPDASVSSTADYIVTVDFDATASEGDIGSVREYLQEYDPSIEFIVEDTLPPRGGATVTTDAVDFCASVQAELEARSSIDRAQCSVVRYATPLQSATP